MENVKMIVAQYQTESMIMFGIIGYFLSKGTMPIRFFFFLIWSALFVGLLLLPAFFDFVGIPPTSTLAKAITAFSPLVAIEIVSILSVFLPKFLKQRLNTFVGVKDDSGK